MPKALTILSEFVVRLAQVHQLASKFMQFISDISVFNSLHEKPVTYYSTEVVCFVARARVVD